MINKLLICPECGSSEVTVTLKQLFMVNTGEHYCYGVKTHDQDSESMCLNCRWCGRRYQLLKNSGMF